MQKTNTSNYFKNHSSQNQIQDKNSALESRLMSITMLAFVKQKTGFVQDTRFVTVSTSTDSYSPSSIDWKVDLRGIEADSGQ